jgi:Rrf2 family protein
MTVLAFENCSRGSLMTSEKLASSIRTNPTVVRRLVARLTDANLVRSYKGKSGGIELARKADEISLRDIYSASSEKTLLKARNKRPARQCPVSCSMGKLMKDVIDGVETNSMDYLAKISLADLAAKVSKE